MSATATATKPRSPLSRRGAGAEDLYSQAEIVPPGNWLIGEGSHLGFSVRSLALPVRGSFRSFHGRIVHRPGDGVMVSATIDVPSIDTGVGARDAHLRSADFFDAANFPEITFASRRIIGFNGRYDIPGAITIKGITRDISLAGRTLPPEPGDGDRTVRLAADGVINRTDFGVRAPAGIEGFGLTVARHVKLSLLIVAIAEERLVPGARP